MRASEVEQWVITILDRLEAGRPIEDDRVELRRKLPSDHDKAARRIAGHANQARQDRILWIAGVDQKTSEINGVEATEDYATWWQRVEEKFDEIPPSPTFVSVPTAEGRHVIGVGFDTSRPPYVIRTGDKGVSREIPWREGTRIRTATRDDVLQVLVPLLNQPEAAVLGGNVEAASKDDYLRWSCELHFYLDTPFGEPLVFPDHRCTAAVMIGDSKPLEFGASLHVDATPHWPRGDLSDTPGGRTSDRGDGQLFVSGSGPLVVRFDGRTWPDAIGDSTAEGAVEVNIESAGPERVALRLHADLVRELVKEVGTETTRWVVRRSS